VLSRLVFFIGGRSRSSRTDSYKRREEARVEGLEVEQRMFKPTSLQVCSLMIALSCVGSIQALANYMFRHKRLNQLPDLGEE